MRCSVPSRPGVLTVAVTAVPAPAAGGLAGAPPAPGGLAVAPPAGGFVVVRPAGGLAVPPVAVAMAVPAGGDSAGLPSTTRRTAFTAHWASTYSDPLAAVRNLATPGRSGMVRVNVGSNLAPSL